MSERYIVKITAQAQTQMREIINYISYTLQAPVTARKILGLLERAITSLEQLPARMPLIEEEPWRSQGIRKLVVKNYLIYFYVTEATRTVQVLAVIYSARDQRHQLSKMDVE